MPRALPYASRQVSPQVYGESATIIRRGPGALSASGLWEPGAIEEIPVSVSTAPSSGVGSGGIRRELRLGGYIVEGERSFWSSVEIRPGLPDSDGDGDFLRWDDRYWRVTRVEKWADNLYEAETVHAEPQDIEAPIVASTTEDIAIRRHIAEFVGEENVRPAHFAGPEPPGSMAYVTVLVADTRQIGEAVHSLGLEDDTEAVRAQYRATVSVQVWRDRAGVIADNLIVWFETEEARESEAQKGIRLVPPFVRRNLSDILAGEWENRQAIDLTVEYSKDAAGAVTPVRQITLETATETGRATRTIDGDAAE